MEQEVSQETKALSVSAALALAKDALESFTVTLIGEISEVSNKPGYKAVYFSVKDKSSSLPCMMWLNRYNSQGIELRVGMLVELTGRFSLYAPKGRMNFDVFKISLAGEGDLRMKVADLARKLSAEGLMDPARKRALPAYPQSIGLVTSPRGAAVHDVLRTLRRRFPLSKVVLAGVPVEGERAPEGLKKALETVSAAGAEVVLLVRGGGSFEDLMPFNDEQLARTIAALPVPVVTGIGHEPDTTIADMVSDLRASTPTAAAEAVSPSREAFSQWAQAQSQMLGKVLLQRIEREKLLLEKKSERALFAEPESLFSVEAQTLDVMSDRLHKAIPNTISRDLSWVTHARDRLLTTGKTFLAPFRSETALKASRLQDLSPLEILARGYSITRDRQGQIVKTVKNLERNDAISVDVSDGVLSCKIEDIKHVDKVVIDWEENNE